MANRGIRELLRLTTMDLRFYLGTFTDYSTAGQTITPSTGLGFARGVGQVVGVTPRGINDIVATTLDVALNGAFSFEVVTRHVAAGSNIGDRMWCNGNVTPYLYWDSAALRYTWSGSGGNFNTGLNSVYIGDVVHLVGTRAVNGDCVLYLRSVRGYVVAGGNTGAEAIVDMSLFNRPAFSREAPQDCSVMRFFSDELSEDEAARLHEHSRIRLWPGAPKRSGIMSPVV